ncbi:DUF6115 domain-containing protein [Fervidobacterium islandicum]|uniref:DUF6115 domain-containing protein n=1 Tax=Fervidobacterium islandicum TaxID=2423 RepID=UPI003CED6017
MSAFHWFVVLASISSLIFAWATYILESFKKRTEKSEIDEEEEKLVELIGKVRIFVDSKLEQLEKKMEEAKNLIKELNEQYVSLATLAVQLQNQLQNLNSTDVNTEFSSSKTGGLREERSGKSSGSDVEISPDEKALIQGYIFKNVPSNSAQPSSRKESSKKEDEYSDYEGIQDVDGVDEPEQNKKEVLIFDMYLSGLEPVEIAKKMKMGVGEVQLIIDLMKRQRP